ncbi:restriction endonuclease subunit R [Muribaculaceae bacterium Isolate-002 (NCI)]|nr:restriction endonuclease subunit R [Muribaculaceae bacterium Isolate-002 (NCI)]
MKQIRYQQKAVDELVNKAIDLLGLRGNRHTLVFKSPTGSGKTVMASEMLMRLNQELAERPDAPYTEVAYIWIAPNKLHEQSYFKMKNYFTENCVLRPVIYDELDHSADGYIKPGEILFVNWESINKDKNLMVRETENSASLYDITRRTQDDNGIPIVLVIDEEHMFGGKNAKKSEKVLATIQPKVEIRVSATPQTNGEQQVNVPREKVIEEEMIKENIVLNPALDFKDPHGSLNQHLIWLAMQKREELAQAYKDLGVDINPLLLIQLPNDTSEYLTTDDTKVKAEIIASLDAYGVNTANGKLAIWLSGEKTDNLDMIDRPNDPTEVLLFKQAIALGWDCPRAAVLLIFRKIESFQFSAQTVGRILRMPEQKYYTDQRLNQGYVYTNLSKDIIEIVKDDMDYLASNIMAKRREGISNIVLDSEYSERLSTDRNRLGTDFKEVLKKTFIAEWGLESGQLSLFSEDMLFGDGEPAEEDADVTNESYRNRHIAINQRGINFNVRNVSTDIVKDLDMTGEVGTKIVNSTATYINNVADLTAMYLAFCKRLLGNDYEQRSVKTLGGALKEVMEELFEVFEYDAMKIILSNDNVHHNRPKFERLIAKAIQKYTEKLRLRQAAARRRAFKHNYWVVPAERAYPVDTFNEQPQIDFHALLPFMEFKGASTVEHAFASFLESQSNAIEWWYKNGDQGKTHYAIGYTNSLGEKALFYVDFIIRTYSGDIFLFDTKTENSDPEAPYKHNALWEYMQRPENKGKKLHGGIIIPDDFDNWVYSPAPLDVKLGTSDTTDWDIFDPQQYI